MTSSARSRNLARVRRLALAVELRERANAALAAVGASLPLLLLVSVATLGIIKVWRPGAVAEHRLMLVPAVAGLLLIVWGVRAALRRLPPYHGAVRLDRCFGLMSRLTTALSLAERGSGSTSAMEELAIEDGLAVDLDVLRPRKACPIRRPPLLGLSALLFLALAGLATLEVRTVRVVPPTPALAPLLIAADDLAFFRQWTEQRGRETHGTDTLASVHRIGRLVDDLDARRLDRREALRRIAAIEQSLVAAGDAERAALDAALERLARELEASSLTKPAADALDARRLEDAATALKELAERLKHKQAPSRAELERLRKALDRAASAEKAHREQTARAQDEVSRQRQRLLKKKKEQQGKLSASDQQELDSLERQHRRLERERQRASGGGEPMTELEKQLAQAARELMKDLGRSAQELEGASESMQNLAERRLSEQEQRELLERLRQLRETVRQQGQGGEQLRDRLSRFGRRARGEKDDGSGMGQGGRGKGQQGKKPGGIAGIAMGSGAAQVRVPTPGGRATDGKSGSEGESGDDSSSGRNWGTGEGPEVRGEKTAPGGETHDTTAVAADTGQGSASSEVIQGAAERGFVGRGYRDVYTAYEGVAERALDADEIPAGYRLYVRRYFQLIRPRE